MKCFYKKQPTLKTFFAKTTVFRSTAHGSAVLEEYLCWLKNFEASTRNRNEIRWCFKQYDVGNNGAWGDTLEYKAPYTVSFKTMASASVLSPLFYGSKLYEIDKAGGISIDGKKSGFSIGQPKAWAIAALQIDGNEEIKLVAIVKGNREYQMLLAVFDITKQGIENNYAPIVLSATLETESYLVCFGRHIFAVHNSVLHYFYLNTRKGELERVTLSEDKMPEETACCNTVLPCVVADSDGKIYWRAGDTVYAFTIGSPKNVELIERLVGKEITSLQCAFNVLTVYVKSGNASSTCYTYCKNGKGYSKTELSGKAKKYIFLKKTEKGFRYIATGENTLYTDENGKTVEIERVKASDGNHGGTYFLQGTVVGGIRCAGLDNGRNIVLVK